MSKSKWLKKLNPASFRGIRFGVLGSEARFGRRIAEHEYPNRDKPYLEDMGRSTRVINVLGFLVEGDLLTKQDDVLQQRDLMIGAAEKAGPGILIHPTMGQLTVSIPDGGLAIVERWDEGRYFELHFSFVESGNRVFPTVKMSTLEAFNLLIDMLGFAGLSDFVRAVESTVSSIFEAIAFVQGVVSDVLDVVESAIETGQAVVNAVVDTVAGFQQMIGRITHDASSFTSLASLLTGDFGRYTAGASTSSFQQSKKSQGSSTATISSLIADSVTQRATVAKASAALTAAAASFSANNLETFVAAARALITAAVAGIATPADKIRLLTELSSFTMTDFNSTSPIGQARTVAQYATATMLRRAALAELISAVSVYAPSSYDEAMAVRATVLTYVDAEILLAGDLGDDATYSALQEIRQVIVKDLDERGGSLAALETYTLGANLPSLVLANRLYQDPGRSDELIAEADPIHPAFMPASFRALAR